MIVVGVDGSEGSVKALRIALEEARLRGSELKVVNTWHISPMAYGSGWAPAPIDLQEYESSARAALDESLEKAGAAGSGVSVTPLVREGQPAEVLCAEARAADLLVVGSRGLGGFRGLLLGSVSHQCALHAPCPLLIVPNRTDGDEAGEK